MRTVLTLVVLLVLAGRQGQAQTLSTDVYPSDEELFNAVLLDEISFSDYVILREILTNSIDSTTRYLLDEIPNLTALFQEQKALHTTLEKEQQQSFLVPPRPKGAITGKWRHTFYQELSKQERNRYRSVLRIFVHDHIRANIQSEREYSGKERFTQRTLSYQNTGSIVREIYIGNFTKRFGLGTVYGYRGKLLTASTQLDHESLLFPDYGGANGVYVHIQGEDNWSVQTLVSLNRDTAYRLTSSATMATWKHNNWLLAAINGVTRIVNRANSTQSTDSKIALSIRHLYSAGYVAAELCSQINGDKGLKAAVWEGRHRFAQADIRYAGWWYDNSYIDLTAGSKAGNVRHTDTLTATGFDFSTKRTGTTGGFLKTVVALVPQTELVQSVVFSTENKANYEVQILSGIIRKLNSRISARVDFLNKTRHRTTTPPETIDQQTRLEMRVKTGTLSMRSYIGYHTKTNQRDYWSIFLRLRMNSIQFGKVDIWAHLARVAMNQQRLDYWYGYIRNQQRLFANLYSGFKLSHRYNRHTDQKHVTTITMEVTAQI